MLAIVALGVPLALSVADRVDAEIQTQATSQADLLAAAAADLLAPARHSNLTSLVARSARATRGRVIVVDAHGRLIADSARPGELGVDFSRRPEIATALAGTATRSTRQSLTLGQGLLATAVPILRRGRPAGVVRVTQSLAAAHHAVRRQVTEIALIASMVLLAGLAVGAVIAGQIARPLRRLEAVARRVAAGDLDALAPVGGSSEQRSLARSFNDMTVRLTRLVRGQQQFVADASHQLRTPLAGLRLRVEEASVLPLPAGAREQLDAGMREVDRLARTIDELLELSQAGEHNNAGEQVDPRDAARRARDRWRVYAAQHDIALVLALDEDGPATMVWCAASDLDRALDALIENALRYAPSATTVTIAVDGTALEVRDQGPGLAPDEEEQVFERFHRGRAGRAGPRGSGLGLPIARALVRRWDGETTIANRPQGGAVARLQLSAPALPADRQLAKRLPKRR